jgi:hypothetical protein
MWPSWVGLSNMGRVWLREKIFEARSRGGGELSSALLLLQSYAAASEAIV